MSWKSELLKGLVEVKGEIARHQGIITTYDLMVNRQQVMIEKLLDRIQAPSFRELKVVGATVEPVGNPGFYDPGADEDLAGMALPMEDGARGNENEG
uniref:Uncharacterized protein n=1 Tax=viral metagenome TaxID=1070528 RepID=A0A6M3KY57_9ZZZZ